MIFSNLILDMPPPVPHLLLEEGDGHGEGVPSRGKGVVHGAETCQLSFGMIGMLSFGHGR